MGARVASAGPDHSLKRKVLDQAPTGGGIMVYNMVVFRAVILGVALISSLAGGVGFDTAHRNRKQDTGIRVSADEAKSSMPVWMGGDQSRFELRQVSKQ